MQEYFAETYGHLVASAVNRPRNEHVPLFVRRTDWRTTQGHWLGLLETSGKPELLPELQLLLISLRSLQSNLPVTSWVVTSWVVTSWVPTSWGVGWSQSVLVEPRFRKLYNTLVDFLGRLTHLLVVFPVLLLALCPAMHLACDNNYTLFYYYLQNFRNSINLVRGLHKFYAVPQDHREPVEKCYRARTSSYAVTLFGRDV